MALNNNFQNIDLSQLKEWVLVDKIPVLYKEREQTQQYIYCKSGYTVYYSDSFSYITGVPAPRNSDAYYGDTSTKLNFLLKDYTAAQFSTEADFLNTLRGKYFAYSYSNSYGYCANTIYYMPMSSSVVSSGDSYYAVDKLIQLYEPYFNYKEYKTIFSDKRPVTEEIDKIYIKKPNYNIQQHFKPVMGDYLIKNGKAEQPYGFLPWNQTSNRRFGNPVIPTNNEGCLVFGKYYGYSMPLTFYPLLDFTDGSCINGYIKITAKRLTNSTNSSNIAYWYIYTMNRDIGLSSGSSFQPFIQHDFFNASLNSGSLEVNEIHYIPITNDLVSFGFYYSGPQTDLCGWFIYDIQIVENEGD